MRFKNKARGAGGPRKIGVKQGNVVRRGYPRRKLSHMNRMRQWLASILVCSVVTVALLAVFAPRADEILSKLLPALMLILAYYYGRKR